VPSGQLANPEEDMIGRYRSAEEQRRAYVEGEWGNPLTTIPLGGRILSAMQLPWFTLWPPRGFGVLTTIGRRTGKRRRTCVRAIRSGDRAYLVSLRGPFGGWMRNIEADAVVTLRIREGRFGGRARSVTDPAELERARQTYCGTVNRFDRMEHRMHRRGRPTPDRIRALHEHWFNVGTPVSIDLSGLGSADERR
jgi:deazaflavin-dependent oxidoreductase (nitroreductase family)